MKPPICSICQERFFEGGGLIYFARDAEDEFFYNKTKIPGWVGHPPNAYWFCEKHIYIARKYAMLTKHEAMSHIKAVLE